MATVKLVFVIIMFLLGIVIFVTPMFFPESKYKNNQFQRTKIIVRIKLGCFLVMLVLLLLCMILK